MSGVTEYTGHTHARIPHQHHYQEIRTRWIHGVIIIPHSMVHITSAFRRRMLIVADDLGMTHYTNRGIMRCVDARVLDAVSLVVNMPYAMDAMRMWFDPSAHKRPALGLHLNFTEGTPCTDAQRVNSLCSGYRQMHGPSEFWARCQSGDICELDVYTETTAQIERFYALTDGCAPAHIDGHHHCHLASPAISETICRALNDSIPTGTSKPRVRSFDSDDTYLDMSACTTCTRGAEGGGSVFDSYGFRSTPHFVNISSCDADAETMRSNMDRALQHHLTTHGAIELMCHPAYHNPTSAGWYDSEERHAELQLLLELFTYSTRL